MEREIIHFVLPVALQDVFGVLAPTFEAETGHRFETAVMLNPKVPDHVASGAPWSIAASNPEYVDRIAEAGACEPAVRYLGLSPLAFAVRGNAGALPADDADAITDVLSGAHGVAVTEHGTSGARFMRLAEALGLTEMLRAKLRPMSGGELITALLAGKVDVAVLPLTNVAPIPGVRATALCPALMSVHVDLALCIHPDAGPGARLFADRLAAQAMAGELRGLGLWPR